MQSFENYRHTRPHPLKCLLPLNTAKLRIGFQNKKCCSGWKHSNKAFPGLFHLLVFLIDRPVPLPHCLSLLVMQDHFEALSLFPTGVLSQKCLHCLLPFDSHGAGVPNPFLIFQPFHLTFVSVPLFCCLLDESSCILLDIFL